MSPFMAHRVISLRRKIWSLTEQSGQIQMSALTGSVANDPKRTYGIRGLPALPSCVHEAFSNSGLFL
jgi:hypothetical protein